MGAKVTIDSASMVNKGLEVMEAHWLFDVPIDDIKVHVHRQSILHSAVQFSDGAVMAQLGTPDMRLPIQYALTYPNRVGLSGNKLDLFEIRALTFEEPDPLVFKGLKLAIDVGRAGGNLPTAFNAADEEAVKLFLVFMTIVIAILVFGFIIFFHELGHFIVAKRCGVKVNEFCLGFGPRLIGIKRGETDYCLRLLPLGGACVMEGEEEDTDDERSFLKRPIWQRALIIAAGPLFNFLLAFILAAIMIGTMGISEPVI